MAELSCWRRGGGTSTLEIDTKAIESDIKISGRFYPVISRHQKPASNMQDPEFSQALIDLAERAIRFSPACRSEEATKIYLVMPFFEFLGYDTTDPTVVVPEHDADFNSSHKRRVDLAILANGEPSIAIEVKQCNSLLDDARDQLRGYYTAMRTVRLGVATDGLKFEFFMDHDAPNVMDQEPFMILDLRDVASGRIDQRSADILCELRREKFDPDAVARKSAEALLRDRLKTVILQEFREPSEELCRFLLGKVGVMGLRVASIDRHYRPLVATCIEEAVVVPVVAALKTVAGRISESADSELEDEELGDGDGRVVTTETELAVFDYVRRRLAFLVKDHDAYQAIERIDYRDQLGKFVIFLDRSRKGRLLEYVTLPDSKHKFTFADSYEVVITSELSEIDSHLVGVFNYRLRQSSRAA